MKNILQRPRLAPVLDSILRGALGAAGTLCPPRAEPPDLVTRRSLEPSTPSSPVTDTRRLAHVRLP